MKPGVMFYDSNRLGERPSLSKITVHLDTKNQFNKLYGAAYNYLKSYVKWFSDKEYRFKVTLIF